MPATTVTLHRTTAGIYTTPDGAYTAQTLTAEDGYRTYRVKHVESGMVAVVCHVREIRTSIAAHIASHGRTWHPHLVSDVTGATPMTHPYFVARERAMSLILGTTNPNGATMTDTGQPKRPETVEEFHADQLRKRVERVATDLRRLADDVEREVRGTVNPRSSYAWVAHNVTNEIMGALMNMQLGALSLDASEADKARAKGE